MNAPAETALAALTPSVRARLSPAVQAIADVAELATTADGWSDAASLAASEAITQAASAYVGSALSDAVPLVSAAVKVLAAAWDPDQQARGVGFTVAECNDLCQRDGSDGGNGYTPVRNSGPNGRAVAADLFIRPIDSADIRATGAELRTSGRWAWPTIGRALWAVTETTLGPIGLPADRRRAYEALRLAMVDARGRPGDGGEVWWWIYVDLLARDLIGPTAALSEAQVRALTWADGAGDPRELPEGAERPAWLRREQTYKGWPPIAGAIALLHAGGAAPHVVEDWIDRTVAGVGCLALPCAIFDGRGAAQVLGAAEDWALTIDPIYDPGELARAIREAGAAAFNPADPGSALSRARLRVAARAAQANASAAPAALAAIGAAGLGIAYYTGHLAAALRWIRRR
jgi:hypothetical protein